MTGFIHLSLLYYKRIAKNICAPTREECEEKLAELIVQMKAEIAEEKTRRKAEQESAQYPQQYRA